jgi:hypothetical protein
MAACVGLIGCVSARRLVRLPDRFGDRAETIAVDQAHDARI